MLPVAKKILFIAHRIPYPPNKGDKIRSFHELEFLSKHYEVHLVCFIDNPNDRVHVGKLRKYAQEVHAFRLYKLIALARGFFYLLTGRSLSEGYYASPLAKRKVRKLSERHKYSFVFCFSSQIGRFAFDIPFVKIMDFCDVDSDKFSQYAKHHAFPLSRLYRLESRRLSAYESQINRAFDASILINRQELRLFNRRRHHDNIYIMPNGIDTEYFKPIDAVKERALVFTGDMGYYANINAMVWFCEEVWPLVLEQDAGIRLYIVGRNPAREVRSYGERYEGGIVVTGEVEDIRPYVAKARLAVIPIRIARGIQNKILEAMAMGVPVMMHRTLFQSLGDLNEKDSLIFDDAHECADMILSTIDNETIQRGIGERQRNYVLSHHHWDSHFRESVVWQNLMNDSFQKDKTISKKRITSDKLRTH
ncbi:MAG: TIGR03087 family PEP-CTERM/XrtA system glycosyltransferase [Chitinivibrionales bacterium]|nr:TIGR03087 family PEP-CTERM/XrtA system glycosyltransferase [Chitinivibrionales bacterium]MBD3355841.1 TIGR03087 family PEP-CTERM/XrtA system glycosyltransferase [Chitinivibrionales bacterium]